jgi:predicted RNase H-like HicB family nuclease
MSNYTAIFESAADGAIWGWIPEIPGATGMGETIEQAEASLRAGLDIWIETEREFGRCIPPPSVIGIRTISTGAA